MEGGRRYSLPFKLAHQFVNQTNLGRALRLLDRHRLMPGEEDL